MSISYWAARSMSRRAALRAAAVAGGGVAALSLVGCGGDDDDKSGGASPSGASATEAKLDATKGKPGGTIKYYESNFPPNFDILLQPQNFRFAGLTQGALLDFTWGVQGVNFDTWDKVEPNLAQAMPEQPDNQRYIFKLRQGVKYHNGRLLTSEDIKYSYDRWASDPKSRYLSTWKGFYEGTETPDPQTVVVKTKFPMLDTLPFLASHRGEAYILNKEHEESPEATSKLVGTGPYTLAATSPPVTTTYRRNPDYYKKPYPYFDEIQTFVSPDNVKQRADFFTRQVHLPWFVYIVDRDEIKKNRPDAKHLEITPFWGQSITVRTDQAPWNDARVRQALSLSIDRNKYRQALNKGEGVNDQAFAVLIKDLMGTREVSQLGAAAKFWDYNLTEAKRLFSAAGVTLPFESTMTHWNGQVVGQWFPDGAILLESSWKQDGIANVKDNDVPIQVYQQTAQIGKYEGLNWSLNPGYASGIAMGLVIRDLYYWGPNGEHSPQNQGYVNDARLSELAAKQLQTFDREARRGMYREMEQIIADQQYRICMTTGSMNWFWDPSIANANISADIGDRRYLEKWWFA